jgi:hypothetical protein
MDDDLRTEAIVFGRYLVGRPLAEHLIERYVRANQALFASQRGDADHAVLAFARRHSWSVAMLDAATGITGGDSLLRKKLLVMTAIVETTPEYVELTAPRADGWLALVRDVGAAGARTALEVAAGLALAAVVRRGGMRWTR